MSLELLMAALGWCTIINWGILLFWVILIFGARDWVYGVHSRMFPNLTPERFDYAHYMGMAVFKVTILLFNLVPYLALRIVA